MELATVSLEPVSNFSLVDSVVLDPVPPFWPIPSPHRAHALPAISLAPPPETQAGSSGFHAQEHDLSIPPQTPSLSSLDQRDESLTGSDEEEPDLDNDFDGQAVSDHDLDFEFTCRPPGTSQNLPNAGSTLIPPVQSTPPPLDVDGSPGVAENTITSYSPGGSPRPLDDNHSFDEITSTTTSTGGAAFEHQGSSRYFGRPAPHPHSDDAHPPEAPLPGPKKPTGLEPPRGPATGRGIAHGRVNPLDRRSIEDHHANSFQVIGGENDDNATEDKNSSTPRRSARVLDKKQQNATPSSLLTSPSSKRGGKRGRSSKKKTGDDDDNTDKQDEGGEGDEGDGEDEDEDEGENEGENEDKNESEDEDDEKDNDENGDEDAEDKEMAEGGEDDEDKNMQVDQEGGGAAKVPNPRGSIRGKGSSPSNAIIVDDDVIVIDDDDCVPDVPRTKRVEAKVLRHLEHEIQVR